MKHHLCTGTERFIDLIAEGGPDIVIDNINCTGAEESLTACRFSFEVRDCLGNITHKVGVRCHEESKLHKLINQGLINFNK